MNLLKTLIIFSIGLVVSSCGFSKEITKSEGNVRVIKYPISSNFIQNVGGIEKKVIITQLIALV